MAEEEFTESEVVFSDHHSSLRAAEPFDEVMLLVPPQKQNSRGKAVASSLPATIPERRRRRRSSGEEEAEEEMVPPHEIVGRRVTGKMAFSVCTGNGRTLKGRDLSQVRNSILRLTGFLEA
ncbi:hypothetical protein RJT34_13942 [Clitoria ternatea]|uniref:Senescence regulator n=1 Tax=Clitoria ternatea TaxID=43366 RepID=A0AAN9JS27_CLITE